MTPATSSTLTTSQVQQPASSPHHADGAIHVVPPSEPRVSAVQQADGSPENQRPLDELDVCAAEPGPAAPRRELSALERMNHALLLVTADSLQTPDLANLACTSNTLHDALQEDVANRKVLGGLETVAAGSRRWLRDVIRSERSSPSILTTQNRASALFAVGLYTHALTAAEQSIATAPSSDERRALLAKIHLQAGRPELAVIAAKDAMARDRYSSAAGTLVRAQLLLGKPDLAREALEMVCDREEVVLLRAMILHAQGRTVIARGVLDRLAREEWLRRFVPRATDIAEAYAFMGDVENALAWMRKATQSVSRDDGMTRVALSPLTAGVRDRRWAAVRETAQRLSMESLSELRPAPASTAAPVGTDGLLQFQIYRR